MKKYDIVPWIHAARVIIVCGCRSVHCGQGWICELQWTCEEEFGDCFVHNGFGLSSQVCHLLFGSRIGKMFQLAGFSQQERIAPLSRWGLPSEQDVLKRDRMLDINGQIRPRAILASVFFLWISIKLFWQLQSVVPPAKRPTRWSTLKEHLFICFKGMKYWQ